MNVYICTDHDTHYPVGGASIVVANNEDAARELLRMALKDNGLDPDLDFTLALVDTTAPQATILVNGDY